MDGGWVSDTSQGTGWWQASDGKWYAPGNVSADRLPAPPVKTTEKLGTKGCLMGFLGLALTVGVVMGIGWAGFAIDHALTGQARFWSKVELYKPTDSSHLYVSIDVKNIGSKAGVPSCQVEASSFDSSDYGVTTFTVRVPVDPGFYSHVAGLVIITNQGAEDVSSVTATC